MKIKSLHIKNFKSLVDLEIVEPNPFTVFVGANGVGKSNIFEALEFAKSNITYTNISTLMDPDRISNQDVVRVPTELTEVIEEDFGGSSKYLNRFTGSKKFFYDCDYENTSGSTITIDYGERPTYFFANIPRGEHNDSSAQRQFYTNFTRLFIGKNELNRLPDLKNRHRSARLFTSADNLGKVLKRVLSDDLKREVILDYLQLLIPELESIEVRSENIGGEDILLVHEKREGAVFPKDLISDGTYNILCLLTAIYQSDEPQFLCIEEPENGLNPFVIKELVNLFRAACEEKGHYIWLNTHSQSLVETLTPDEIILVDKVNGETKIKQIQGMNLHGLATDDAWFSGALGGGMPW